MRTSAFRGACGAARENGAGKRALIQLLHGLYRPIGGPVLPILAYDTIDEAVERANATPFALGASVWSADPDGAGAVADRLEAGTV